MIFAIPLIAFGALWLHQFLTGEYRQPEHKHRYR